MKRMRIETRGLGRIQVQLQQAQIETTETSIQVSALDKWILDTIS
jgi:hypothetical protein